MSASYLEGDYEQEDDNSVSLAAIKKRYKQGSKGMYLLTLCRIEQWSNYTKITKGPR